MTRFEIQESGEPGVIYETGTTALTGLDVHKIVCLTATQFATLTDAYASGDAITGIAFPAGTVLRGKYSAVTLASGAVALFKAARL